MPSKNQMKSQELDKLLVRLEKIGPDDKYTSPKQKDEIDFIKGRIQRLLPDAKKDGGAVKKMNMGGMVMNTTKAMPVDMMGGGKVKPMKMNMGGVVPGRGGKFKGVR